MEAAVRRVSRCAQMARVHRIGTRSDTESDAETCKLLGPSGASAAASPQRMLPTFFTPAKELSSGKTIHSDADASEVAFRAKLGAAVLSKIMRRRVCRRPRAPLHYRRQVPTRNFRSTSPPAAPPTRLNCRRAVLTNAAAWARKKGRAVLIVHVHVCLQAKDHLLSRQHYLLFWRQHSSTTVEALRQAQFH